MHTTIRNKITSKIPTSSEENIKLQTFQSVQEETTFKIPASSNLSTTKKPTKRPTQVSSSTTKQSTQSIKTTTPPSSSSLSTKSTAQLFKLTPTAPPIVSKKTT